MAQPAADEAAAARDISSISSGEGTGKTNLSELFGEIMDQGTPIDTAQDSAMPSASAPASSFGPVRSSAAAHAGVAPYATASSEIEQVSRPRFLPDASGASSASARARRRSLRARFQNGTFLLGTIFFLFRPLLRGPILTWFQPLHRGLRASLAGTLMPALARLQGLWRKPLPSSLLRKLLFRSSLLSFL